MLPSTPSIAKLVVPLIICVPAGTERLLIKPPSPRRTVVELPILAATILPVTARSVSVPTDVILGCAFV